MIVATTFFALAVSIAHSPQTASAPEDSTKIDGLLRQAEDALNRRQFGPAVTALQSVVKLEPDMAPAWFNLGYAYTGLHHDQDAAAAYRKALDIQPDLFEARLNLGILLVEMDHPRDALEHLQRAAALKVDNARAHLYYARALAATAQPGEAEKQFQEAIRLQPALAIAHFDLAQLELSQKAFEPARAEFEKAAGLDPQLSQAQLGQALALEGLKRPDEAIPHLETYLEAKPDDLESRFHLARIYLDAGRNDLALNSLQNVYSRKPDMPGLAAALGDVCALLKIFPDSEKFYRQALATSPGEADLRRALGRTLLDEEKYTEAEEEFRAALKLDPKNLEAFRGLTTCLYLEKRYGEAIPMLEAQARATHPPAATFFVLATCYDHLQARKQALAAYEEFLSRSHGENPDQEWQAEQRAKLLRHMLGK